MNIYHENQVPWPVGKAITPSHERKSGQFSVTLASAAERIEKQVGAFTKSGKPWRTSALWIYAEAKLGGRNRFLANQPRSFDPRVVVSFDIDGKPYAISADRLDAPEQNLAAIAAYIEAMRSQERYGIFTVEELLQSFSALPPPSSGLVTISPFAGLTTADAISALYRDLAKAAHPDMGGSDAAMALLNLQRDEALKAVTA